MDHPRSAMSRALTSRTAGDLAPAVAASGWLASWVLLALAAATIIGHGGQASQTPALATLLALGIVGGATAAGWAVVRFANVAAWRAVCGGRSVRTLTNTYRSGQTEPTMAAMTEQTSDLPPATPPSNPRRPRWIWYALAGIAAGVVLLVGVAFAVNGGDPEPSAAKSTPTPTASPSPTEPAITSEQERYLNLVRPIFLAPDADLLALGKTTCDSLDGGVAIAEIAKVATDITTLERYTFLIGTATWLCPAHEAAVTAWRQALPPIIDDGTWTVGTDLPAGRYRPEQVASADCYWAITRSGSNGDDIVNNSIGGGRPVVTLKAGQDFETARCGTWVKF